jgi:hypothetical protein
MPNIPHIFNCEINGNQGINLSQADVDTLISYSTPEMYIFGMGHVSVIEVKLFVLCFFDALDRAYSHALRRIEMTNTLHTGFGINHIDGAALGDGAGGAFRFASAA